MRSLFGLLGFLPDGLSLGLARGVCGLLRRAVPRLTQVARRNLELTGVAHSERDQEAITRRVFDSIARLLWVTAKTASIGLDNTSNAQRKLEKYFTIENAEIVHQALGEGRGILFATAHLGAWELSAVGFGAMVQPMDVIARPLDNPLLDEWVTRLRERTGNRVLAKSGSLREVLRALEGRRSVGFLLDHNVISSDLVFVRFLGVEASASSAFAKIAARTGAAVIPGFCVWEEAQRRFVLRFYPRVEMTGMEAEDTQRIHSCIEAVVREYPDQWLWIHRRFKTRPAGETDLYQSL